MRAFVCGALALGLLCTRPAVALDVGDARHLLSRTGYGASPAEIAKLAPLGRAQAVDAILAGTRTRPTLPPPAWTADPKPPYWGQQKWTRNEREAFRMARVAEIRQLKAWWFAEMIATPSPLTERMTMFWHNHFTSSFEGTGNWSHMLYDQQVLFREQGFNSFAELVRQILHDPAMLRYLDNQNNRKGRPNENLARELLELFTLGEGHYSERDIKETARALTGWTVDAKNNYVFIVNRGQHDDDNKTIFGQTGRFDGNDVARIVLAQPRTAEFVVEKLWREFISEQPDREQVVRLAASFRASDYAIKPLLRALLTSTAFWAAGNRAQLIKSPVDLVVGTIRTFGLPLADVSVLPAISKRLGQDVFDPPNVKGWIGGNAWINSGSLVIRYQTVDRLMSLRDIDARSMIRLAAMTEHRAKMRISVAGEACKGSPAMTVEADGARLADISVDFAYETDRLGRVPDPAHLERRVLDVPLPKPAAEVREVRIAFINDFAVRGADGYQHCNRNLVIDWIELGDARYAAEKGAQDGKCGISKPGRLSCNETLTMNLAEVERAGGLIEASMKGATAENMMPAANAMGDGMRGPAAAIQARAPVVYASFADWVGALPAAVRAVSAMWRAVLAVPPIAPPDAGDDTETILRQMGGDIAYQLR
ncbi:MAG: DUF1800 family protein [Proteobacteria bacterium]|nr:DUF1800 family protein [Pseudomonadota bacterium]